MSAIKRSIALLVILGVVFFSLACSLGNLIPNLGGNPTATPNDAVAVQPATTAPTFTAAVPAARPSATALSLQGSPTAASPQRTPTSLAEPGDIQTGLDKLDSYQMDFVIKLEGKDSGGKDAKQNLTLFEEVIHSKNSMHLKMEGTGLSTTPTNGAIETYQIGGDGYLLMVAENQTTPTCLAYSSDSPMVDMDSLLTPGDMLGEIKEQSLVAKGELVNGVKTDHYKITRGSLGLGTVTSESGDAWLAQDGNFLVRYTGQAEGEFELTDEKITGTITWTYNLSKINRLSEIVLAPECAAAGETTRDIPIPPNATDQSSFGELMTFTSPDAPKDVADFYRGELPVKGWKIDKDSALGTMVILRISKDDRTLQITISPGTGDKGSSVMITKAQ